MAQQTKAEINFRAVLRNKDRVPTTESSGLQDELEELARLLLKLFRSCQRLPVGQERETALKQIDESRGRLVSRLERCRCTNAESVVRVA